MAKPAAQIVLERYWDEVNNQGKLELIRELCADPITRHDPGKVTTLSHDEQIARVKFGIEEMGIVIDRVITHASDTMVTSVWNMTATRKNDLAMCGIEVFKLENGRLAHCWNTPYAEGHWD
ncbi:nuclear transport factor 2 family protein [Myxococcota bacterium]|nr:nuclear transport factor 2 family protein [Myxococcota bacterium]